MSKKSVSRSTAKQTAKAKPATVSDHLQRMVQAMPEKSQREIAAQVGCAFQYVSRLKGDVSTSGHVSMPEPPKAPEKAFRSNTLDRMAEHRDFAGRVAALTVAIQRDHEEHGGGLVPDLLHALEDLAHAEYSLVAGNMSAIAELQAGREVPA